MYSTTRETSSGEAEEESQHLLSKYKVSLALEVAGGGGGNTSHALQGLKRNGVICQRPDEQLEALVQVVHEPVEQEMRFVSFTFVTTGKCEWGAGAFFLLYRAAASLEAQHEQRVAALHRAAGERRHCPWDLDRGCI